MDVNLSSDIIAVIARHAYSNATYYIPYRYIYLMYICSKTFDQCCYKKVWLNRNSFDQMARSTITKCLIFGDCLSFAKLMYRPKLI